MTLSKEMRLLANKWAGGQFWPKRLESIEIHGLRGWTGQKVDFEFPIVALVGENGAGKSTVLQAAASVYKPIQNSKKKIRFASNYFPDTPWEVAEKGMIKWWVREGTSTKEGSIRKFPGRWRGNPDRRERNTENIDLSRIQPFSDRVGYMRLAKSTLKEASSVAFDEENLNALSTILNKKYEVASMSATEIDETRAVPVISHAGARYSGFHSGAGETTMVELLRNEIPDYSLVVIDEIETSLHPRAQRRLLRHLAELCRLKEIQIILSTHSPYILDELPPEARLYIWEGISGREIIKGVSPQFAMTKMDLEQHPECDIYVEDREAAALLREILVAHEPGLVHRCQIVAFGAASVGQSLGLMAAGNRFPRPTCIFLDGDQSASRGCFLLPGDDAPERVVFEGLSDISWDGIALRVGRSHAAVADACQRAMTADDHHEWPTLAADELTLSSDILWQTMCSIWATKCLSPSAGKSVTDTITLALS